MKRTRTLFVIFASFAVISACSTNKPPELAAVNSKHVLASLRDMTQAYEKKNADLFLANVSADFPGRAAFSSTLTRVFAKYETIHFTVQHSKMLILIEEKGRVRVTFTWNAEWIEAGGSTVKDGGRTTLVFEPDSFKLASIDGKNPFLAQPGETPGSKP